MLIFMYIVTTLVFMLPIILLPIYTFSTLADIYCSFNAKKYSVEKDFFQEVSDFCFVIGALCLIWTMAAIINTNVSYVKLPIQKIDGISVVVDNNGQIINVDRLFPGYRKSYIWEKRLEDKYFLLLSKTPILSENINVTIVDETNKEPKND